MAPPPVSETLELHDIQGLVLRGYGTLRAAQFLVLEIVDDELARAYLQGLVGRLNLARDSPAGVALQVAFTAKGLAKLGVPEGALATFSREFLEGMDDDVRAVSLGDLDGNESSGWRWGKRGEPMHVLLMVYAETQPILDRELAAERARFEGALAVLHERTTTTLAGNKEHFGWRDGISMPTIADVPKDPSRTKEKTEKKESWTDPLPAGEFVLGYKNDYQAFTECPTAELHDDPGDHLPRVPGEPRKSLGKNGTYLVFREMTQDVSAFWSYLAKESREPGADACARAIALGAKLVGRWPSGAPLATSPERDRPEQGGDNEFLYTHDTVGLACPRGAHIRRANPRDVHALEDRGHSASIAMVRKHQMIRRGRAFGPPVVATMEPEKIFAARDAPRADRGLHFICLVGDISRQFEFVQRNWIQSANFDSLYKDGDPLIAARRPEGHRNQNDEHTVAAEPLRRKYKRLPRFTQLVGGGYFFLPGIAALKFIARLP